MKIYTYKPKKVKKSWPLFLDNKKGALTAVDSKTGEWVTTFVVFQENGDIFRVIDSLSAISHSGYDPYEYGNKFDNDGKIIIG